MITPIKRTFSLVCAFCMIFVFCSDFSTAFAASEYSEQTVEITGDGQTVDSFMGIDAEYVTYQSYTGYYCCAGYVSRFYSEIFGATVYNINMIDDKPSVYVSGHTAELRTVTDPLPGDIMQTKQYDHVAIVKDVDGSEVTLIEQNYKYNHWQTGKLVTVVNRKCTASENYYYRLYIDGKVQALDKTGPAVTQAKASKISGTGYTVSANVSDKSGVAYVKIGTYLKSEGLASAKWRTISNPSANVSCAVKTVDFTNADDTYVNVIKACDNLGNISSKTISTYIDTTPPVISNIKISGVTAKGYTVTCTVSDSNGIDSVKFPTWTTKSAMDDLDTSWAEGTAYSGTISGSTAKFYVSTADHNNEKGEYNTYVYAYDTYGNSTSKGAAVTVSPAQGIVLGASDITVAKNESTVIGYSFKGTNVTDAVTWTSSDKNTAAVSNGRVTGKKAGTAVITAKTSGGKTAKCTVKVTEPVSDMSFFAISDQYYTGGLIKPAVTVKNGSKALINGTDYTVSYSYNRSVGTAQVVIKGKGLYTGVKKLTFKICPAVLKNAKVSGRGADRISLSWSKYSGAQGYYVYRYNPTSKKWVRIADVNTNSYTDKKLASCTVYKYKVKAYLKKDGTAYYGKATNTITVMTNPLKTTLKASRQGSTVKLSWNAQSKASGYQILVSPSGKTGTYRLVKTVTKPSAAGTVLTGIGKNSCFRVRAYKNVSSGTQYGFLSAAVRV